MFNVRHITLLALVLLVVGGLGSLLMYQLQDEPQPILENLEIPDSNITTISIEMDHTDVELLPTKDSATQLKLMGMARTEDNLSTRIEGNTLTVQLKDEPSNKWFSFGNDEPKFQLVVYLPEKAYETIQLDLDNGSILASQLQAKKFDAVTVNGPIELQSMSASSIKARSENGKLILKDLEGDIEGYTENGLISMRTPTLDRTIQLESKNGGIRIETAQEPTNVTLDVQSDNGYVDLLDVMESYEIIGKGEHSLRLHTVNGSVTISRTKEG